MARAAALVDADAKSWWRWEQGLVVPRSDTLLALADALGVSMRWLLTGAEENAA